MKHNLTMADHIEMSLFCHIVIMIMTMMMIIIIEGKKTTFKLYCTLHLKQSSKFYKVKASV